MNKLSLIIGPLPTFLPYLPDYLATTLTRDTAVGRYPWDHYNIIFSQTFTLLNPDLELISLLAIAPGAIATLTRPPQPARISPL